MHTLYVGVTSQDDVSAAPSRPTIDSARAYKPLKRLEYGFHMKWVGRLTAEDAYLHTEPSTFPTYVFVGYSIDGKPAISSFKEPCSDCARCGAGVTADKPSDICPQSGARFSRGGTRCSTGRHPYGCGDFFSGSPQTWGGCAKGNVYFRVSDRCRGGAAIACGRFYTSSESSKFLGVSVRYDATPASGGKL